VKWDFDGTGTYVYAHLDGTAPVVTLSTTHGFDRFGLRLEGSLIRLVSV
jgi:hypothetical protein